MTCLMIDRHYNSLTARQYIIELLLKGLHRLEYRGYDRFVLSMMMTMMNGDNCDDIWWHASKKCLIRKYAKNSECNYCEAIHCYIASIVKSSKLMTSIRIQRWCWLIDWLIDCLNYQNFKTDDNNTFIALVLASIQLMGRVRSTWYVNFNRFLIVFFKFILDLCRKFSSYWSQICR